MARKVYAANKELLQAYTLIFSGTRLDSTRELYALDIQKLKDAYRKKVKENHPDRAKLLGITHGVLTERFKNINIAYASLASFIENNKKTNPATTHQKQPKKKYSAKTSQAHRATKEKNKKSDKNKYHNNGPFSFFKQSTSHTSTKNDNKTKKQDKTFHGSSREKNYSYNSNKSTHGKTHHTRPQFSTSMWMPPIVLPLGQYLLYCGLITLKTLIEAIQWQRSQRPAYGEIACGWKIFSRNDIYLIYKNKKVNEKFGECALRLGLVTSFQNKAILSKQKNIQKLIGQYFIEQGILTRQELEQYVHELKKHNALLNIKKAGK